MRRVSLARQEWHLDQEGRYVVETVEDRTIRFDVRTGEPIEGEKP